MFLRGFSCFPNSVGYSTNMKAKAINDAIIIIAAYPGFFGDYIDVHMVENNPRLLPKAIIHNGKVYGLSGHNTDLGKASYATGKAVGIKIN